MKQMSIFDILDKPEPPPQPTGEFVVWFANVSGQGEHVLARTFMGERDFCPRNMILQGAAEIITFSLEAAIRERDRLKARLGAVRWNGDQYEIEDLWNKESLDRYLTHKEGHG